MIRNKIALVVGIVIIFSNYLFGEHSYKPYPIIYVHGLDGNPSNWGVKEHLPGDTTRGWQWWGDIHNPDSIDIRGINYLIQPPDKPHTIYSFKENYFERPGSEHSWYDTLYSGIRYSAGLEPPEIPNLKHIYQEVIAMNPNDGSIDPEGSDIGQGAKVWHKIQQTLKEYYGPNWQNNPDAKVILVCHSAGGLATRQAIYQFGNEIKPHIAKVITLGTPHCGANPAALGWLASCFVTIVGTASMLAGICGPGPVAIAISASEILFPLLFEFGGAALMPMVRDLSGLTGFLDNLNYNSFQGGDYTWHCLVGKQGWYWAEPLGGAMITLGVILSAQLNPVGPVLIADGGFIIYWDEYSDGVVETSSQNLNNVNPAYGAEIIEKDIPADPQWSTAHSEETSQWEIIRDFLEPLVRVTIDSAIVFAGGERTAYALPNENNVIETAGDSLFLKGRTNCYFLANADFSFSRN
jgi:pimeloyl-ACP methyl ester carboxylesterase